ncbi:hypothetical protein [Mucilaginibacter sp. JRF]|nr:hypothetical protein [Mucilaginibacter sp. JRF]
MLEIYKHYNGDGDMFSRLATAEQKQLFENEEWTLIDNLLQTSN